MRTTKRVLVAAVLTLFAPLALVASGANRPTTVTAAWVQVSVATVWYTPSDPQPIDAPALGNPARITRWLARISVAQRLALASRIMTQSLLGQRVVVLGHRGAWSRIEVPNQRGARYPRGIIGWVPTIQLSAVAPPRSSREEIVAVPRAWLHAFVHGTVGRRRFLVSYDTELPVVGTAPGDLVVGLPGGETGAITASALRPVRGGAVSGAAVAAEARRFLGLPYLWGGTSSFGYDCSGLVYSLYARFGRILPRDARDQRHAGVPVALSELRPGDLLFFAGPGGVGRVHHVAIYVGGGRMIDAPYTGTSVEMIPMTSSPMWGEFAGAIRLYGVF
jgi:cell wall-associated NlpC family hydrolase